jgi:hypothetical protein
MNYLILHGKRYIHEAKLNNKCIFLFDFLVQLKNDLEVDEYVYSTAGDNNKFVNKYGLLYEALF